MSENEPPSRCDELEVEVHRWTLLLSEDREEITLRLRDGDVVIDIPLTLQNAQKLEDALHGMISVAEDTRRRRKRD
jgi:hypothetical protein